MLQLRQQGTVVGHRSPAVDDHGSADIDNIALDQLAIPGDARPHDMVDPGAEAVGKAAIAQRRWDRAGVKN